MANVCKFVAVCNVALIQASCSMKLVFLTGYYIGVKGRHVFLALLRCYLLNLFQLNFRNMKLIVITLSRCI